MINYYYLHHFLRLIHTVEIQTFLMNPRFTSCLRYPNVSLFENIDRDTAGAVKGSPVVLSYLSKAFSIYLDFDGLNVVRHDPGFYKYSDIHFGLTMAVKQLNLISRNPDLFDLDSDYTIPSHYCWPVRPVLSEDQKLEKLESMFPVIDLKNRFWYLNDQNLMAAEEAITRAELAESIINCNQKSVHLLRMHLNAGFKLINDYGVEF